MRKPATPGRTPMRRWRRPCEVRPYGWIKSRNCRVKSNRRIAR
uniref:Uncharacterized protein n=1 Tax=Arundo donax TaxID=35708 RepID=A0A0A9A9W0_ARUDO